MTHRQWMAVAAAVLAIGDPLTPNRLTKEPPRKPSGKNRSKIKAARKQKASQK